MYYLNYEHTGLNSYSLLHLLFSYSAYMNRKSRTVTEKTAYFRVYNN